MNSKKYYNITTMCVFLYRTRRSQSPPNTRSIEEVPGSDKLMVTAPESGYSSELFSKSRNSGAPSLPPPNTLEDNSETISVREYKSRNGAEVAHVHVGGGTYGRVGCPPPSYATGSMRPPSHVYESPTFS